MSNTALAAAHVQVKDAVLTQKGAQANVGPVIRDYKRYLLASFSTAPQMLADFGMQPPKARKPLTSDQRAAVKAKQTATRTARGTTSKKQKLAIKGDVTSVNITPVKIAPVTPPTAAPAASPAVASTASAATPRFLVACEHRSPPVPLIGRTLRPMRVGTGRPAAERPKGDGDALSAADGGALSASDGDAGMPADCESLGAAHVEVLELIARGTPLPAALDAIVRLIERQADGILCSVLLLDREAGRLRHGAAPHLPEDYVRVLDGSAIGPEEGSCGAAAYREERIVVEDIATHAYWAKYRSLALPHGLRACWSSPIFSPAREVLGTFAIYYREPRGPTEREIKWVGIATHLASIAIMRDRAEQALRRSEARAQELARLHTVSSGVSEALLRLRDPHQVYDLACRIAVEKGLAVLAWVGVYDAMADRLLPAARFGRDDGYIDTIRLGYSGKRVSTGPAAQAMRTGTVAISNDIANDPNFFWKAEALRRGLRSCAVLPIRTADATQTLLAIYGEKTDFFHDEEVAVLGALADNIAFALKSAESENERHRLYEQLRQAQKMEAIGRLASGVAHDFNNILSVILGYSELIGRQLNREAPLWSDVDAIRTAGLRAANLTSQLLAFSRQQVIEPKVLDLNESITEMKDMLRRLLGADVELTTRFAPSLWNVKADPGQVQQIVMNLVVNARDAMPDGGKLALETRNVEVGVETRNVEIGLETRNVEVGQRAAANREDVPPGSYVMLLVTDTGIGMDAETRSRIFEPFFTTKQAGRGTGLGLATVFGIVMQSGGHIAVDSEPGQGATFKVYLRKVEGEASPRSGPRSVPPETSSRGETILIVEDDDPVRAVAREILQRYGYSVLEASNGGEALLICEQHPAAIDLLLTDVVLPRMSGRQLADRLTPIRPEMKVLFMSGYTDDAILRHRVLDSGAAFLQKPITSESLTRKVAEVLRG